MTKARVKVSREALIRVVDGRLRKLEKVHERQKSTYPARLAKWHEECAVLLERKAAQARSGKLNAQDRRVLLPPAPEEANSYRERCQLERSLKTLKIGTEDAITLAPEDADYYFGPCQTRA